MIISDHVTYLVIKMVCKTKKMILVQLTLQFYM